MLMIYDSKGRGYTEEEISRVFEFINSEQGPAPFWIDGEPDRTYGSEWFMAEMLTGERVALVALEEEHSYDYRTADRTYFKAERIKRWAQFPDSDYVPYHADPSEVERLRAEVKRHEESAAWWGRFAARQTQRAHAAERKLSEVANVLQAVQEQFNRYGDRLPDGFDTRVFRWVDDAVAAQYASEEPADEVKS